MENGVGPLLDVTINYLNEKWNQVSRKTNKTMKRLYQFVKDALAFLVGQFHYKVLRGFTYQENRLLAPLRASATSARQIPDSETVS